MLLLVVFAVIFTLSEQCCMDKLWEGVEETTVAVLPPGQTTPIISQSTLSVAVDADRMINAVEGYTTTNGVKRLIKTIQDYKDNVHYSIVEGQCYKVAAGKYQGNCVPDGAVKDSEGTYGVGPNSIAVTTYSLSVGNLTAKVTVNSDCVFTNQVIYGEIHGQNLMSSTTFRNITLGVKDPSVFDIPSICHHATVIHVDPPHAVGRRFVI